MPKLWSADSVIDLVDSLLSEAARLGASDLHLDPQKTDLSVRLRIDGTLVDSGTIHLELHESLIARVKVLAGLRGDLHTAAQDGRFSYLHGNGKFDIRVAIAPTFYGENAVLRLLPESGQEWTLDGLGFSDANRQRVLLALNKPTGMILATGPTGSGKTTTLYTLLRELNKPHLAVVTLEDPVEYAIPGVRHIAVNTAAGLTFSQGLRWLLRQNPDVLLVGEIRDGETAKAAVHAALTGHLILSSLHTQDSATALIRLLDLGVEHYLITSTVSVVVAQRLVRRLCDNCKAPAELPARLTSSHSENITNATFWKSVGCQVCRSTGFRGRIGIQEVLLVTEEIAGAVARDPGKSSLRELAVKLGMQTLFDDGLEKARQGLTSFEEVVRAVQ